MGFRLALAQAPADLDTPAARMAWLRQTLARMQPADLLLLPELFACGYNIGAKLAEHAEPADGPTAQTLAQLAKTHGIAIHCGMAERAGDTLYNATLCFGPDGALLDHYRKIAIPPGFERDYFTAGAGCRIFSYRDWQIATLICYDGEFPETVRHVARLGAELVLVPTALGAAWDWVAQTMIPTRAYENGLYLAYANSAGEENGSTYLGKSVIAAPNGTEAARAGRDPQILYADLDKTAIASAQSRLPYLLDVANIVLDA